MNVIETGCCEETSALLEVIISEGHFAESLLTDIVCEERENCLAYNPTAKHLYCPPECLNGGNCNGLKCEPNENEILKLAKKLEYKTTTHYDRDGDYTFDVIIP